MYKNQLQELAQRSCFNLPSYTCIREGPDHAPRFKACVNFNGEIFEAPGYCTTLRQAEHAAAEVAFNTLSTRGPSRLVAARVLDEIGVYKNLLQESVHRAGLNLPVYTTERSGPGHLPVFISIVELAGINFTGEAARTKKQAEKNAAMAAWSALKQLGSSKTQSNKEIIEEQEHVVVARVLSRFNTKSTLRSSSDPVQVRNNKSPFLHHNHRWKNPMGISSDISSTQSHHTEKCSLLAHHNTSTPSVFSKILPPTSTTDRSSYQSLYLSTKIRSNSRYTMQGVQPPLEEHQKDEDEWLNGGRSDIKQKSIIPNSVQMSSKSAIYNQPIFMRKFSSTNSDIAPSSSSRMHGHGIAPAVQIRSVIPVCAAPPRSSPPSVVETPSRVCAPFDEKKQDLSPPVPDSTPQLKQEAEQDVQATCSKFNSNLHL
ncbi:Double-stranded RNA-binding protein [Ranunculus cassubicifolius]